MSNWQTLHHPHLVAVGVAAVQVLGVDVVEDGGVGALGPGGARYRSQHRQDLKDEKLDSESFY